MTRRITDCRIVISGYVTNHTADGYRSTFHRYRFVHLVDHFQTMKRQSASSYHNPSKLTMSKTSHSREVSAKPTYLPKVVKYVPPPSLTAKQLKAFQYLDPGVSFLTVLEGLTTNKTKMRDRCAKTFHGYDDDHLGVVNNFLTGQGRFDVLWEDDRIASGFGDLSGLRRDSIDDSIRNVTLRGVTSYLGAKFMIKPSWLSARLGNFWHTGMSSS